MTSAPVALVAGREIRERLSSRAFLVATLALVVGVVVLVVLPSFLARGPAVVRVAAVGEATAPGPGPGYRVVPAESRRAAEVALRAAELDVVVDVDRVLVRGEGTSEDVRSLAQRLAGEAALQGRLRDAGLSRSQAVGVVDGPPLPVRDVVPEPVDLARRTAAGSAVIITLYGALLTYCSWVGIGVAAEKANRVVDVMLATVRAGQYLAGKLLGIACVALAQLATVGFAATLASLAVAGGNGPQVLSAAVVWGLLWFGLGFALYSCAFAAVGAAVPRPEDAQSALAPLTLLLTLGYGVGMAVASGASAWWTTAASLLPPLAPLTMPVRLLVEHVPWWQPVAAVAGCLACGYLCVRVGAALFVGGLPRRPGARHDTTRSTP